eukprot:COSAG06_NODE_95_length_24425_cov_882.571035_19_plen_471_part_00
MLPRLAAAAALVALAHAQHPPPSPPRTVTPGCDSEDELLGNLRWLRDACAQAGEQFDDDDTLVPGAVTTRGCAAVVRRVASDCGGLLARSPWFASRRAALDVAAAAASALTGGDGVGTALHVADPSLRFVYSCGAVLDDGFAQFPSIGIGQSRVAIDVGPSRGTLRLDFETLTLDAKKNDNLRLYADADENEELRQIFSGNLPLTGPIEVDASAVYVLLVSDGASTRTSLRVTVSCVCEDSATFADADGDGCAAYAQGSAAGGEKHLRCASLLEPTDDTARSACPLACGACSEGPCAASPCQNGGTCSETGAAAAADGGDAACTASDLGARSAAVDAECCDEPTEDCSSGEPATCNVGCAAVLVPYFQDCLAALQASQGGGALVGALQSTVSKCGAAVYRCDCAEGWGGASCEVRFRLCHPLAFLPAVSCRAGAAAAARTLIDLNLLCVRCNNVIMCRSRMHPPRSRRSA